LTTYLAGADFRRLGIELACFAASSSWRQQTADPPQSLSAFGAIVLQHRWKKLVSAGKQMDELDVPGLHGVRLRAKRARYAAEMFATLYPGKAAQRFIGRLGTVQQRLGVLNDGAVATHLLEQLGGAGGRHGYATGVVVGFLAARSGKIRPRIIAAFEKFRRQPAYWT
jgi:triphosphatase